jgi:fructose-bisphosphate aldolase class II
MAFVSLRQVLDHAVEKGYGVPVSNVNNLEQIIAIIEVALKTSSPVILQASAGARKPTGDMLAMDRIVAIHAQIPNTHLVMHGSSSVPQEWLAIICQFGGDIKETYGVPVEEIQRGIKSGVRKINIDTDIRLAMTGAMRQVFAQQPSEFDPRKALMAAKNAARGIVKARFEAFGCAGQGGKIKPMPLEMMAKRYK